MTITIAQIKNADLRQMATAIDNGDGKINHSELQELISGFAEIQTLRFQEKCDLDKKVKNIEDKFKTQNAFSFLGGLGTTALGGLITKSIKGALIGCLLGLGTMIYIDVKNRIDKNKVKDNKEALRNDENLNSMAAEVKELVSQMAGGSNKIGSYLADKDGGEMSGRMNAKTWNNYTTAVYGNLREEWSDADYMKIDKDISAGRAQESLDIYDSKMSEI